jgi:hypothetical protein
MNRKEVEREEEQSFGNLNDKLQKGGIRDEDKPFGDLDDACSR